MLPRTGQEDTDIIMVNELTSVVPVSSQQSKMKLELR